jgi:hypothetical protein
MATNSTGAERSHAYELFILVLTVFSLMIMVVLLLPLSEPTLELLRTYDNLICVVFLFDFFLNLLQAPSKREYFFGHRGWLDLIGSIPSLGVFRLTGLLRLARPRPAQPPGANFPATAWPTESRDSQGRCRKPRAVRRPLSHSCWR